MECQVPGQLGDVPIGEKQQMIEEDQEIAQYLELERTYQGLQSAEQERGLANWWKR